MTNSLSKNENKWINQGSIFIQPPDDYWIYLKSINSLDLEQLEQLQVWVDGRQNEFSLGYLPNDIENARNLLNRFVDDGWFKSEKRFNCPICDYHLSEDEAKNPHCPDCNIEYEEQGGIKKESIYIRTLAPARSVDWVIAIHGMNTKGEWQEAFNWFISTTWGRSVPVAIYKYGIIIAGVLFPWRRRKLQKQLRIKIKTLYQEAYKRGYHGKPDIIAHSFGTWLIGHLLRDELKINSDQQIKIGRIILTGSILRPDFNWENIKKANLVEDVLNHYCNKDMVVPCAQFTIWDSGPSGRRGFDGNAVINICSDGYGHSDLFSIDYCIIKNKSFQTCPNTLNKLTHLENSYHKYWRPFLTLPKNEYNSISDRKDPKSKWKQLPWILRATIIPLLLQLIILGVSVFIIYKIFFYLFI